MRALLAKPFMGTELSVGGAIAIFVTGPAFWLVFAIAWAALPA
ncbi:hypothetical protein ACFQZU_23505 [Streptomonospora algeriensis]|uniref:Uncharacterized protein n=1 Tax=Streptomonospora algeriensis TaxID=995084 RepID=A0ABW3BLV4_9ACTN